VAKFDGSHARTQRARTPQLVQAVCLTYAVTGICEKNRANPQPFWQRSLLVLLPVSMVQMDKSCIIFPPPVFTISLSIFVFVRPVRERKRIIQSYYFLWLTILDIKLLQLQSHLPPFLESSFFCAYSLASRLSAMPAARISALLSPWYVTLDTQVLAFGAIHCSSFIY
jgi:hypothetical protein